MKRPYSDTTNPYMSNCGGGAKRPAFIRSTKKLVIKNLRQNNSENGPESFENNWSILEDSCLRIQQRQKTDRGREELYKLVEVLCLDSFGSEIYVRIVKLFTTYLEANLERLLNACDPSNHIGFLVELNHFWVQYCEQLSKIQNVFTYLDRTYVLENPSIPSIWDAGLNVFRRLVVDAQKINQNIYSFVLKTIQTERQGEKIDRSLLKSVIWIFSTLQIYEQIFEPKLLKITDEYYKEESKHKIETLEIDSYLKHVAQRLDEEQERVLCYLNQTSRAGLSSCVDKCFVGEYIDAILAKGAEQLFRENRTNDIRLLYRLFGRVKNARQNLKNSFVTYIKKVGRAMVTEADSDKNLVKNLMDLKENLDKTISECFENNEKFIQGERDAFSYFINIRANKPAELIAKYMDAKLRSGNKECSEDELDVIMDRVIVLFRFVDGKDYFEAFYKKALAKRLLMSRSASVDSEKAMLSKLKNECGAGFTQKLEGMFKDMEISKDLSNTFATYLNVNHPKLSNIELNVSILTMGNWPTYQPMEITIPRELKDQQEVFTRFYTSKHNGRQLQWHYSLGCYAILKASFAKVRKELEVSMFQARSLLCFNDNPSLSFKEIQTETKIEADELKRTLQSLACGKFRVLNKEPKGKDVDEKDQFLFNEKFNDRLYRIRISQVMLRETEAEHRETEEQVSQDRQYQIDAAIVRIMKTRKTLAHNLLLTELINQLRFATKPVDLKKRIESLLERDYIARDKNDQQLYNYVA